MYVCCARGIESGFEVGEGRQQVLRYARDEMGVGLVE
jgi:hypothetical protein